METTSLSQRQAHNLIFYGVLLFLLGLLVGFVIPLVPNPRIALSSHMEGVMNGLFLMVLGAIWSRIALSDKWLKITFGLAVYGTFANWLGILLAALLNAGKMLPIAAPGNVGSPAAESVVTFLLVTLSIAMVAVCCAVLVGLNRGRRTQG